MMGVGAFGDHEFGASESCIRIPKDFEFTESLNFEMQERVGKKPATYIKGLGEMTFPMTIHLDARMLDTDLVSEIDWWLNAMRKQTKGKLYLFRHYWGTNSFIVTSVHPSNTRTVGNIMLSCDLEIKLTEWVAEGSASTKASSATAAATDVKYSSGVVQKKADRVKNVEKATATAIVSSAAAEQTVKAGPDSITVTAVSAGKKNGNVSVTVSGSRGGGRARQLSPGDVISVEQGSILTVTWDSKKTYWLKVYYARNGVKLANGNNGKLGPVKINSGVVIKACWR